MTEEARPPLPPFTRESAAGPMRRPEASINDAPIREPERKFLWPEQGKRPGDYPGLTELDL